VPSVFRRKSTEMIDEPETSEEVPVEPVVRKSYTPKKGEATPKRVVAGRRVEAAPANRKEAMSRSREKSRTDRAEQRAAMMAGDERYLMPRDKGPVRALVRDVVDSRTNVGSFFIIGMFLILFGSVQAMPSQVQIGANFLFVFLVLALVVDSALLCRKVRRLVRERFPKAQERWNSLYFYAVMRAISFRRLRVPRPRVKVGAKI
jgi:hypothetical protein